MKIHSLQITPKLLNQITAIDAFNATWKVTSQLHPERLDSLRRVATIESVGSSTRIEGAKLTDKEVEDLLGDIKRKSFVTRDEQEVAGYAELMETVFQSHDEVPLTENYIKQFHAMLLRHSTKDERHRGRYKNLDNHLEAFDADGKSLGVVFQTASPFDTPREMEDLVKWTTQTLEDKSYHPLIVIAVFKVKFLEIHPFQDGNGRLSRVLTTLLLLKAGYGYVPYSSLESIIERNKDRYYLNLRRTQSTLGNADPDWAAWLNFFFECLNSQIKHLSAKMTGSSDLSHLPKDSAQIVEFLKDNERITITEAEDLTGTARATLKLRLSDLIKQDLIVRNGRARGTWYSLKK